MLLACALVVVAVLAGCGAPGPSPKGPAPLVSGSRSAPIPPRDLGRARTAAHRFAASLLILGSTRGAATLRGATPSLARRLVRVAAQGVGQLPGRGTALLALAVSPIHGDRVKATATLAPPAAAEYPISFELVRDGRRWLVDRLPGG